MAREVVARHAMRRLLGASSLGGLDAESLFYLTWRWAYQTRAIGADEAYKLERAFDVDLGELTYPRGFAEQDGSRFRLLGPHERSRIRIGVSPWMVDVLHLACRLWESGRWHELFVLLGSTGMGLEPTFWAAIQALTEMLPVGEKERTMLLGLGGSRDRIEAAAARGDYRHEQLTLPSSNGG
jgi:putative DNA methylase